MCNQTLFVYIYLLKVVFTIQDDLRSFKRNNLITNPLRLFIYLLSQPIFVLQTFKEGYEALIKTYNIVLYYILDKL